MTTNCGPLWIDDSGMLTTVLQHRHQDHVEPVVAGCGVVSKHHRNLVSLVCLVGNCTILLAEWTEKRQGNGINKFGNGLCLKKKRPDLGDTCSPILSLRDVLTYSLEVKSTYLFAGLKTRHALQ
jgi:hypothetical protein